MKNNYFVDENGFYGHFGGAYIPEILYKCVHDLQEAYLPIIESEDFKQEYRALLRDYVAGLGRPSLLERKYETPYGKISQKQEAAYLEKEQEVMKKVDKAYKGGGSGA